MEPIKQEIINNIFENGDKLITGPILQTVLIDMIDDVNVKDQEILSKTGSWDDAATQIPNLATKAEVTNLSESVARDLENVVGGDLTGYATEQWVQDQGYLKEHQDISGLATKGELNDTKTNLQGNITSLSESVARDLTGYATETWVQSQGYLTEHQDISNLATKTELNDTKDNIQSDMLILSESMAKTIDDYTAGLITEIQNQDYASKTYVNEAVAGINLSDYATKTELTSVSESVQTDITNLSESVANSAVWKKGEGTDSLVQVIADGTNLPTATGERAIAVGTATTASGHYSHAEGGNTKASGWYSHAEGGWTKASGDDSHAEGSSTEASGRYSHAEGYGTDTSGFASHAEGHFTIASNNYEHAQGTYNHNSPNQIFSIGAGEFVGGVSTRRNAISVLAVPNSETQINTASVFVQNIGGYDGTNPTPGTNDLATVINNLPSGGSSETLWKKGTGEDSLVQKLTGANETNTPTASGTGAIAIGTATTASGNNSHAEGQTTVASGLASHAEGYNTIASAHCSHAEGGDTKASGSYSHAEGIYTEALGQASHTEGYRTTASKEGSHAEGESTIASGSYSHAEGGYTLTSNQYEHAQGQYNHNSTNQIFSVGAGEKIGETVTRRNAVSILEVPNSDTQVVTASFFVQNIGGYDGTNPEPGTNDLATVINGMSSGGGSSETLWKKGEGQDSIVQIWTGNYESFTPTASRQGAIAMGANSVASGWGSHAEGASTKASGQYSHAEGYHTEASNEDSHAEGYWTKASGMYSHAEGNATRASGDYSHAEGTGSNASGTGSHAEGYQTIASNQYEHAQGRCNHNSENQIFSIGTGNSGTDRRNAVSVLEVDNSGSYTSSFFVQNVGGYDGTNPIPGTNDLATVINGLSSSGGSSSGGSSSGGSSETLWKKGTGKDSAVLILTGDDEAKTPTATGTGSIATGKSTNASGNYSHAEGQSTKASGWDSHAEGFWTEAPGNDSHAEGGNTKASGNYSHAEGWYAFTTNDYEHAQGQYNHNSTNQIFSVGAGEYVNGTTNRRNAVSVLAVPNSDTRILTASFFVQNVGGYDGTNPTPGTNDLATVINGMSTGGGSSETLWKKGTGTDSIVQVIADGTGQPKATGERAIATGKFTNASGTGSHAEGLGTNASKDYSHAEGSNTKASNDYSHAEGSWTNAKGSNSHAEGYFTNASGQSSHAEGEFTVASNDSEHAQGRYNYTSSNQIFSIGTGNSDTDRRNAVSVLEVDNSGSYTSSFFVQNVGGYDGTNPLPGTNDLATVINGMSTGGGSSETLWKKGEGKDSLVQILTGTDEANTSTATETGSIATGYGTTASGDYSHTEGWGTKATGDYSHAEGTSTKASSYCSHAEGDGTNASGNWSHAEGYKATTTGAWSHAEGNSTKASGVHSHAEGYQTIASNEYEHAQGIANHNSTNQIFSIGAGEIKDYTVKTRRNAISVLAVPNSGSYTSSFFVQNIGGYDGTNPIPGTNDLATVLNNTETWTFTLEDGTTVTKTIRIS